MNFSLLIVVIGAVSVSANKYGSKYNFQFGKEIPKQLYVTSPPWNMPNNPMVWPISPNQPLNWQNQPTLSWPSQPSMTRPNQPMISWPNQPSQNMPNQPLNWPNQPTNVPGSFGQGNQMPSIPSANMNWQTPQGRPGSFLPPYGGNFPNPQMYLYRMKKPEKL